MSDQNSAADRFYENVLALIDLVIYIAEECQNKGYNIVSPGLVKIGKLTIEGYNRIDLIDGFVKHSYPYWNEIHKKEEEFFETNINEVLRCLPVNESHVNTFTKLFTTKDKTGRKIVDQEFRDSIWEFLHAFVRISLDYIHYGREPDVDIDKNDEGKPIKRAIYRRRFYTNVDLNHYCKLWEYKRPFSKRS